MQRQTQQQQEQQQQIVQQQQQQYMQQQQQFSQQRISRTEQHVTRQVTQQQQVQGMVVQGAIQPFLPADAAPPVFEQIFRNARFAQGGNAHFQGKLRGNPKPQVSWTRKGAPLFESAKYKMQYEQQTGNVSLLIKNIGPGDEGEYTCTARNQYGEAICSVFISPEGVALPQGQQSFQQTQRTEKISYTNGTNGHMVFEEDFKVDTFEYRLLREVSFRETVTRRYINEVDAQMSTTIERSLGPPSAPQIAQKPRNSKLQEGSDAVFTVKIAANPKPRLTWFKNGQRLVNSQKHQSSFSNQQATLKIAHTNATDTGHYTLLAENPQGVVVSSAYLAVEPSSVQDFIDQRETTQRMTQVETTEAVDTTKMLAPNFVRVCTDRDVTEGKMTRFDCRVTGRPYPEVAWFINGRQVADDATHKILVNESGNHALMITNVSRLDHGTVTCVARNKAGETSFQCALNVIEKEQVVAPKFVERFSTVTVKEGEPVTLSVRAVGTPIPRISWQKDGVPVMASPDVHISVDGGASILDLPAARSSDAGWYQCMAQNVAGSTATRARLYVQTPVQPEYQGDRRLHLPRPTRVIEPELQPGPEIIYLRHVERAKPHTPHPEEDRTYPPPQFIIPLANTSQVEGGRIHFEARIEPVGDPTMRVEWFHNGSPLAASSRTTTTFKFGFIALDLLTIVQADAGEYICLVTSSTGRAESRATLTVTVRASIEQTSQHPESLQYISSLEDYSRYQRTESMEEIHAQKPAFIRPLHDLGQLNEGRNAHFEGQLTPVSDPTMKVEWYKDGRPITASSRITSIFNFGYVSLNILHLRAEDSGSYTVRAVNRWGEAVSTSNLTVVARSSVTGDLGIPEQQRYIEQVEQLEAYQTQQHARTKLEPPESTAPPVFKSPIKDQLNIREGGFAHFEARLEPIGDSTLKVEWLKDGRPVEASSRITTFFNFGYVALTIKYVTIHDVGIYTCRAYNTLGQAETTAQMSVITKQDIIFDSQHPSGLQKIQHLEDSSRYSRTTQEEVQVTQKPRFLGPLKGTNKIVEGQRAHFEARVEPQSDSTMKIEWYFNGKVIMTANRIQTYHDFGYVALDILSVRAEDAGTYTVVARNALGEAQLSASMVVETRASIDTSSMHHGSYEKTKRLESGKFVEPQYEIEEISKSKPIFITPLSDPKPVSEGKNIHLECRLEPMGDPTMRVEWFHNGRSVTVGSRFRTYYDFGFVALDIIHATSMDTGEYTVRAINHLGSAHTSAQVRVISHSDILTDTQNEAALEQIQFLEDASRHRRTVGDEEVIMTAPQFTRPLHNIETIEGTNIHLECRLQPVGDSTMRVDWFVNGHPVKTGHRFRPAYDFDYVALDLLSVYPEDSGVYTCQARNALGEAVTSCSVKIHAKKDLILESQHPGGLEKIHYLEDSSRYRRTEQVDETITVRPRFVTKPKSLGNMREGHHAHFECKLEPVTDSNLKVEWYKNGRPITVGHRFRPIHDFGYVALDIVDLIAEDSGTYTCRAVNLVGADETSCTLECKSSSQILTGTQNETGLEQIQYLEDRSKYQRSEVVEETTTQAPTFTTSLKHVSIKEAQRAHFECRLIPVSDATMKVEWFHNNVPLKSGSRFTETNNFGFVALDILHCLPEDSGTYTCRARNIIGEAITSANLNVQSKKSIYVETQHEGALQRLHQLEDSSRHQRRSVTDEMVSQAPVFTQPMRDLRTAENQAAHFEARLIPVGDARLKVEWLRNGVPIQASNRVTTMHDFGYVALNMKYVYPEDSGTYTCRAVNDLGEAVTSATLDVQSKESLLLESQHKQALQKIQMLEDSSKYQRREEVETVVTQAPKFTVQLNGPTDLVEGQSAHYECRIEPYPDNNLKVEWFFNGQPLQTGHRFRTTYDFGFAALDVLTVYGEDSGEYTCRATNKLGQAQSSVKLNVKPKSSIIRDTQHEGALQKIQYLEDESRYKRSSTEEIAIAEKPQFGRPLKNIEHLPEGSSAHLEATLTPVNDPTMKVEWFCNGRPVPQGHRFKTTYDFGFVALDILYAYPEDSGTYMCKARNAVGEAVTTCSVNIDSKSGLQLDTMDEQRLKKIRDLENYQRPEKVEVEPVGQKPVFITPLNSLSALKEGDHAHLECRVEPINDPNMKIEWFVNGVAIRAGHRFRTTHDFGYVALDVLYTWGEDTGTYMCKATNLLGEAINTTTINVQSRRSVYLDTQHPEGLEKIRELEAQGHTARLEIEEPIPTPPKFVTELRGTTEVMEGATAHFECQVEPLHDSNLRIEFFHNGKPLPSASRFHITFDFGYVALDIGHCVPEDAGEYSVKVVNKLGQCTSSIKLKVIAKSNIISDSQRPEGLEKIRQLEEAQPFQRPEVPEPVTRQRPVFTQPLQNIDSIPEGTTAHFECRLIPVGDPTLKVEWFRNEKPLEDSSRITKTHDFGFVSMDMTHVRDEDEGVYMCRASNALGEAVTTASMKIRTKADIQLDTLHQEGMRKIQQLEAKAPTREDEPERAFDKPIFTQLLTGPSELWEGQNAHFECRVVPVGDPTMRFEWFVNGVELKMGSRFRTTHDFGFVTLDIMSTVQEDSGVYTCKAINKAGEAVSSAALKVKSKSTIMGEPLQPDAWQKIQLKEAEMNKVPPMFVDTTPQQAPVFTSHLQSMDKLVEGQHVYLEAQVEPRTDPNLRIEWFKNGLSLTTGARLRSTFDFGLVTLSINSLRADDSAIYTCKATNLLGEAVSTCTLKIEDKHWLLGKPLRPEALPLIEALEEPKPRRPAEGPEPVYESPVFISHLNNVECKEGENVHFECHVEPSKDPTMNIEWFVNGKPLPSGSRYKSTYDFGYVSLDINHAYPEDSGVYMCKATNSKGHASTSGSLRCTAIKQTNIKDEQFSASFSYGSKEVKLQSFEHQEASKTSTMFGTAFAMSSSQKFVKEETSVQQFTTSDLGILTSFGKRRPSFIQDDIKIIQDLELIKVRLKGPETTNIPDEEEVVPSIEKTIELLPQRITLPDVDVSHDITLKTIDQTEVTEKVMTASKSRRFSTHTEEASAYIQVAELKQGGIQELESDLGDKDIYLDTQHPQGRAGLEKVQEVEDAVAGKLQRQPSAPEAAFPKPVWTTPLNPEFHLGEAQPLHLEGTVEPKTDPNLKIEWFFNGKALEHGSRFKMTSDFGFVTLDLTEVYERDQGIYTCKASNQAGEAFTSTTIYCTSKTGLIERTQHPKGEEGLEKIQNLEESLRRQEAGLPESELGQPPVFTSQFTNLKNLSEGEIAHFEASLSPVGDQTMVVEWFYNGKALEASHRTRTVHAFGMVVLEILGTKIEDSGTYTCRATNKWGRAEISVELECIDKSKGQKPQFTTQIQSIDGLKDGDSAHFECTLIPVGDPNMKVEWFHNGKPLRHSTRIKGVSDFGFVVLDIAYTQSHDSGEYVCKASNKYGEDYTKATIKCVGKGGVYLDTLQPDSLARIRELELSQGGQAQTPTTPVLEPPVFHTQIRDVTNLKEGQSAHFEARLTPVHDPDLVVEWYFNGKKLPHGHRYRTFHDFGIVILDILYCYEENSGVYECRAVNKVGQDSTKATLKCGSKASLILESQLPQGMEGGLEKIQTLEEGMIRSKEEKASEERGQAPVFTVPLANIDSLREGESAHFEGRLTPTNDPRLKVEWFWNGKPLKTGSRFRTFCDFGFVILEISPVYPEDSGEYSCRASNEYGQAVTTASMKVQGKRSIILESQLPKGMESTIDKIAELEGLGQAPAQLTPEADTGKPPEFITTPSDLTLAENQLAHFECRLTPINDPSMRVEWFHNGKPLWAGSRVKTINDFGFVILEISGCYIRESGLYTCKATNKHGEASVSCKLQVHGRQGIIMEPQLPSNFRTGTESLQKLEESLYKREEIQPDAEQPNPPKFIVELKDIEATEAGPAHFDCRVEPVGDSSMRIDWFFNGRPFATGSRVHMLNDFGFIVLDMDYVYSRDAGEYICRATNKWGTATTKAKLVCKAKHDIVLESQLPQGMSGEKLKELEKGFIPEAKPEEKVPTEPPRFITQIESVSVGEAEPVHFECRVEPKKDPTLRIEWYRNGKLLPTGHRYRSLFDLGYVSLDILYVYPEDSGEYVCKAINDYGEDFTRATISCKKIPQIILQSQVPKGMKRSEALMQMEATIKKYTSEVHLTEDDLYEPEKKQPPRFVTQIEDQTTLVEMQSTKFECQLAPVGDPNMKVEWFLNGKPLTHKNRFTPIYDFGYVAMNFGWVYPEDSGEYLCRATNLYGMDETRAVIKTSGKPGIIYDSQLPKGMKSIEKIRELEAAWQVLPEKPEEEEKPKEKPVFVTKPEPCTTFEGDCARFCCRVTGFPRPRVMWLINGHTVVNGMRYRLTYDGMWHLDIPKTRQYDHGKVEVVARNSSGETRVETLLTVKPRGDDYRGVLKNSPRRILGTKEYRKPEWVTHMEELQSQLQATASSPTFIQEITDVRAQELETATFEAIFAGNPMPDIIWYHNDKIVRNTKNVKITIKENRTTIKIIKVTEEDEGIYICKATNAAGMAVTKASLFFQGISDEQRKEFELREAQEQKVKLEKTKRIKDKLVKKKGQVIMPDQTPLQQDEQQVLESTTQFVETTESARATVKFDVQESVEVSAVATSRKVPDDVTFPQEKPKDIAKVIKPIQEATSVTEVTTEEVTRKLKTRDVPKEVVDVVRSPQETVTITEIQPDSVLQEITEKKTKRKQVKKVPVMELVEAKEVQEVMDLVNVAEFGPGETPLRELATVGILLRHGMTVDEVVAQYSAEQFPALRTAPAQSALVQLVEREGHSALISEVLTQESTTEQTLVGVFQAFLRMIELKHATIEEVLPLFSPIDFQTQSWEHQTSQVVVEESSITHTARITQVHTQEMKTQVTRKTTEVTQEDQESAGLTITKEELSTVESGDKIVETSEGDVLFSICSYVAENEEALNLVEGERVYVIESTSQDWWFVQKHLTQEKGWVPAVYLRDEPSYTLYVQKKLHEKIDKLPIFEKPSAGEEVYAPRFVEKLQPKHVPDGATVQFECQVEGNPRPQITWFRQTAIIKPSQDFQIFYDDDNVATLIIREVFPEDAGTFTCVAKNAAGFASSTTELSVEAPLSDHGSDITGLSRKSLSRESSLADILEGIPPTFSRKPKAKIVKEGDSVELECRLVAVPEPEVTWLYKDKPIQPSEKITVSTQSDMHMYSTLVSLTDVKKNQEGVYRVLAKNREGQATLDIILKVKTGEPEAPEVVEPLQDVCISEGESAILVTQITGKPMPKVVWAKDGKPDTSLPTKTQGETYSLTLIKPSASDSARYSVTATNKHGSVNTSCQLTVEHINLIRTNDPQTPLTHSTTATQKIQLHTFDQEQIFEQREEFTKTSSMMTSKSVVITSSQKVVEETTQMQQFLSAKEEFTTPTLTKNEIQVFQDLELLNISLSSESQAERTSEITVQSNQFTHISDVNVGHVKLTSLEDVEMFKKVAISAQEMSSSINADENSFRNKVLEVTAGRYEDSTSKLDSLGVPGPQAPLFVERFEEQNVKENGTIRLVAKVTGNPVPLVTWFRNNKTLLASPKQTQLFDGENIVLEIKEADSEEDAGDYKCVASNNLGTATHGARVTVDVEQVTFTKHLREHVELNETETVTLECETSHTVSTKWLHDGRELSGMDHREIVQEGRSHRLIIKRATPLDSGTYTCSVKDQKTSCSVVVHGMKPDFIRTMEDFEVKEQETAILEVEISSESADVVWMKDGLPVDPTPGKFEVEKRGTVRKLFIRSSSVHDEGEYTCTLGDQECSAEVTVIELPPQIHTNMQDITVTRGEKATLEVELTKGDALVRWFKDDKELHFSEHVQLSIDGKKQKLKIYQAELSDEGIYSCRVGEQPDQVSTARVTVEVPGVEFITKLPDVTLVPDGADAEFTVELSSPIDVKWLKKGKEIKPSSKYIIKSEGTVQRLVIKKATTEDQTDITCAAANVKTSTKLKVEKVQIAPKIKIDSTPKLYKVKKGEDVNIEVKFTASPTPTDEWTVNGTVIKKNKRVDYTVGEESACLTIKKVEELDAGTYTLKLKNPVGEASAEMTLIIMQVPGEPGTPDILEVTEDSVTLHWKAPESDGNCPITRYILEFHDKEEFMEWHEVEETITVTTHKVTKLTHDAEIMFRVAAENQVGRGPNSNSTRYVRITTPMDAEPPVIQEPLKDSSVGLGKSITLECVIGGIPLPEVKWSRNGKPLKSKKMTFENRVARFLLNNCSEDYSGTYTCKATNSAGSAETTCKLVVQDIPTLDVPEAVQDQRLNIAAQWKPEVSFTGFPRPEITWEKNGQAVISDKRCKVFVDEKTTTIAIYTVERKDTATYTVRATNSAGVASADLILRVIDKPGKPEGPISFSNIAAESINVEWRPPLDDGGLELTKYILEKCESSKLIWSKAADVNPHSTSYTVEKLIENTEYMFRVFAQNSVGTSEALTSEPVVVRTIYDKPSPPQGPLEVSGMTETSCTISWRAPAYDGGTPILDYTIHRKEPSKKGWVKVATVADLSLSMTDLVLNVGYTFKIVARNKEGESEPYISEDPIIAGRKIRMNELTEQALYALLGIYPPTKPSKYSPPSAPLNFNAIDITSRSVTLQWSPPSSTGGTELTGYIIELQYGHSKKWSKVVTLDPGHLQYCVENLKEKSELYFRIYAENSIGLSTAAGTSVISLTTHATVPSPPTEPLEIRSLGPNSIIVEWGVPETDGGAPLEGYKIAIRDIKKTMWMEVGQVPAEVQKLTIKDLQENHEYLVRIFARNEVGLSDPLESDEPFMVKKPTGMEEADVEERSLLEKDTPSLSFSTETTTSWMREAGMDADIHFYSKGSLLRRSEYFFRIWYYAKHLFK